MLLVRAAATFLVEAMLPDSLAKPLQGASEREFVESVLLGTGMLTLILLGILICRQMALSSTATTTRRKKSVIVPTSVALCSSVLAQAATIIHNQSILVEEDGKVFDGAGDSPRSDSEPSFLQRNSDYNLSREASTQDVAVQASQEDPLPAELCTSDAANQVSLQDPFLAELQASYESIEAKLAELQTDRDSLRFLLNDSISQQQQLKETIQSLAAELEKERRESAALVEKLTAEVARVEGSYSTKLGEQTLQLELVSRRAIECQQQLDHWLSMHTVSSNRYGGEFMTHYDPTNGSRHPFPPSNPGYSHYAHYQDPNVCPTEVEVARRQRFDYHQYAVRNESEETTTLENADSSWILVDGASVNPNLASPPAVWYTTSFPQQAQRNESVHQDSRPAQVTNRRSCGTGAYVNNPYSGLGFQTVSIRSEALSTIYSAGRGDLQPVQTAPTSPPPATADPGHAPLPLHPLPPPARAAATELPQCNCTVSFFVDSNRKAYAVLSHPTEEGVEQRLEVTPRIDARISVKHSTPKGASKKRLGNATQTQLHQLMEDRKQEETLKGTQKDESHVESGLPSESSGWRWVRDALKDRYPKLERRVGRLTNHAQAQTSPSRDRILPLWLEQILRVVLYPNVELEEFFARHFPKQLAIRNVPYIDADLACWTIAETLFSEGLLTDTPLLVHTHSRTQPIADVSYSDEINAVALWLLLDVVLIDVHVEAQLSPQQSRSSTITGSERLESPATPFTYALRYELPQGLPLPAGDELHDGLLRSICESLLRFSVAGQATPLWQCMNPQFRPATPM
jgi:hypothetical protein